MRMGSQFQPSLLLLTAFLAGAGVAQQTEEPSGHEYSAPGIQSVRVLVDSPDPAEQSTRTVEETGSKAEWKIENVEDEETSESKIVKIDKDSIVIYKSSQDDEYFSIEFEGTAPTRRPVFGAGAKAKAKKAREFRKLAKKTRRIRFVFAPAFGMSFGRPVTIGPTANLGLQSKRHYFGVNYSWQLSPSSYETDMSYTYYDYNTYADSTSTASVDIWREMFGGAFEYFFRGISFRDIVNFSPGIVAGFWYDYKGMEAQDIYSRNYVDSDELSDEEADHDTFYFAGPKIKLELGYKFIHLMYDFSLRIGNGVSFQQDVGFKITI